MNEAYVFLLTVNIMCTSKFIRLPLFFFVTKNTCIIQYVKSLSPDIIKHQFSYQNEVQKIF